MVILIQRKFHKVDVLTIKFSCIEYNGKIPIIGKLKTNAQNNTSETRNNNKREQ